MTEGALSKTIMSIEISTFSEMVATVEQLYLVMPLQLYLFQYYRLVGYYYIFHVILLSAARRERSTTLSGVLHNHLN